MGLSAMALFGLAGCEGGPAVGQGVASSGAPAASAPQKPTATATAAAQTDEERASLELIIPMIPPDVDYARVKKLRAEGKTAEVQRLFDKLSWQSFIALNWPADDAGKPKPKISDPGLYAWMFWKESFDVFREDGSKPGPFGEVRSLVGGKPTSKMAALADAGKLPRSERLIFTPAAKPHGRRTTADEVNQAFAAPLWDQSGNITFYEVLLNRSEFDYIVQNELYNLDGQIAFFKKNPGKDLDPKNCNHPNKTVVVMPSGKYGGKDDGAMEIKLAWKVLSATDIQERYVVAEGRVPRQPKDWTKIDPKDKTITLSGACPTLSASIAGAEWEKVKLGLVGFHISHKTESGPQWVWATFEQVDNIAVDGLEAERLKAQGKTLKATFNNEDCETCSVNSCFDPRVTGQSQRGNQLARVIEIDPETAALNAAMQQVLRGQGSALQYYELIGTQFPTDPDAIPTSPNPAGPNCAKSGAPTINLPESVANKPGGKPHTVFLTNLTMESFFQLGNQPACQQVEGFNCPSSVTTAPQVFATESCMGCHSSSSIAVGGDPKSGATFGNQLMADFSWLLSQKAQWKK